MFRRHSGFSFQLYHGYLQVLFSGTHIYHSSYNCANHIPQKRSAEMVSTSSSPRCSQTAFFISQKLVLLSVCNFAKLVKSLYWNKTSQALFIASKSSFFLQSCHAEFFCKRVLFQRNIVFISSVQCTKSCMQIFRYLKDFLNGNTWW